MSDIKISNYNVPELVSKRLSSAGWTAAASKMKGDTKAKDIPVEFNKTGLKKIQQLHSLLSELHYFPESNGRKTGELEILCDLIGQYGK